MDWISALCGGVLIGAAVSLMLLLNGRITGISGIIYGLMTPVRGDWAWRIYFIFGLVSGGWALSHLMPVVFGNTLPTDEWSVGIAGLLVGFGTVLGSGCTSGHGVCGISRLSPRSFLATILFMAAGILSVLVFKKLGAIP